MLIVMERRFLNLNSMSLLDNPAYRLYFGVYCILLFVCSLSLSFGDEQSCITRLLMGTLKMRDMKILQFWGLWMSRSLLVRVNFT